MVTQSSTPSNTPPSGKLSGQGPQLLDLPSETLSDIFSCIQPSDLASLCRVSKAVRDLAVVRLYRSLSHEVTESKGNDLAVDQLAGLLETLVTSNFDYASYIKAINLGATYGKQANVAQEFHYGISCGKFLNTLILAAMKRVASLESFRQVLDLSYWDMRVEMSPSMFEALEELSNLHHLHLRMHPGKSLASSTLGAAVVPASPPVPVLGHHHHNAPPPPPPQATYHYGASTTGTMPNLNKRHEVHKFPVPPRTFSRFANLETLAVVEMDTLEYIDEIAECISSCMGTLKSLKLSFSNALALKARTKPTPDGSDTDSAEEDDEWYDPNDPVSPAAAAAAAGATNDPDMRRERIQQEKALSTIFGLNAEQKTGDAQDPLDQIVIHAISSAHKKSRESAKLSAEVSADKTFVMELRSVLGGLGEKAPGKPGTHAWKTLEKLQKAADLYLEERENAEALAPKENGIIDTGSNEETDNSVVGNETPKHTEDGPVHDGHKDSIMDIVDIEHPDDDGEEVPDQEFLEPADATPEIDCTDGDIYETISNPVEDSFQAAKDTGNAKKGKQPIGESDSLKKDKANEGSSITADRKIHEYVRTHHGLPLEQLSLHLIPVKPSVICRAINVWALKHVSLLDVGPQRAFWATLGKLHESNPLQISSIHTDNVTPEFLDFVHNLDCVKELFMFERNSRVAMKSSAPKSAVSIADIGKKVLVKHSAHLERLIIRNDDNLSWALNRDQIMAIVGKDSKLKELVIALRSPFFHVLIRDLQRLRSLEVLHVMLASSDDCAGVLREIRSCAIDTVLLHPVLKVKYVAVSSAAKESQSTGISRIDRKWFIQQVPDKMGEVSRPSTSGSLDSNPGTGYSGPVPLKGQSSTAGISTPASSVADGTNGCTPTVKMILGVEVVEVSKLEDLKDIRVWDKDIWHVRL